ncbi:hypothetical protein SAMN04487820_111163 [Actinopolyspora mzabensis]|uniref:Uncharacterized protein n=2 Tax=Actinopolyspora mzabensis TaxID=995066 RepID=A0A1G9E7A0_ACTMZ|nr:hypothetical protein SAMN04487820_111163 [Actinopolyspora mzabensis]
MAAMLGYMATARTTITLDQGLLDEVKQQASQAHRTVSDFVGESPRGRLSSMRRQPEPFTLATVDLGGYKPDVDISDNASLRDVMDEE